VGWVVQLTVVHWDRGSIIQRVIGQQWMKWWMAGVVRRREYRERGQSIGEGESDCAEARMTKRWSWTSVRRGNAEWRIGARMERDNRSVGTSIRRQAWRTRGRGFPLLPTSKQPPAALPPSHHHHCHCHHHHALSKNSGHRADLSHR
jgi:hypothetical protein